MFNIGDKVSLFGKEGFQGIVVSVPDKFKNEEWAIDFNKVWVKDDKIDHPCWAHKNQLTLIERKKMTDKAPKSKNKVSIYTVSFRRLVAIDIIRKQKGKFFTAIFVGKDGKDHICNGRTGVYKYLKGGFPQNLPADIMNAFNVKKMEYRNIFLDGIVEIRAEGKVFIFDK